MSRKLICLFAVLSLTVSAPLWAKGSASGTAIINTATATYSNSGTTKFTNRAAKTNTVGTIYGLQSATVSSQKTVAPGSSVSFAISLSNAGNATVGIALTNVRWRTNGYVQNGSWSFNFYTNAGMAGGAYKFLNLAEDAKQNVYLVVTAPSGGLDGAAITNKHGSLLTTAYGAVYSSLAGYTGMDLTTLFGGFDWLTNNIAIAVVSAPNLVLAKSSVVSNSASYLALVTAGNERNVVPGSLIVYSITWTNAGSGQLLGLKLRDPIDANFQYVANSIVFTNGVKLSATGANYLSANTAGHQIADDGSFTAGVANFSLTGSTNASTINVDFGTAIPGNSRGTVMYKVIVK